MLIRRFVVASLLNLLTLFTTSSAASITVSLDRWMYPFAFGGGTRDLAPTFGAVGSEGFDNRDGQFIFGFDTSVDIETGHNPDRYQINSLSVRAMVGSPSGFVYDPTYDSFRSYLPDGDPRFMADSDAGRPIELHGVGFRNGYTQLSFGPSNNQPPEFEENAPFGPAGAGTRNVFPLGFPTPGAASDISNNVQLGLESQPWALGTAELAPGDAVDSNTTISFEIDFSHADVLDYLQRGLKAGSLGFAISSLHEAAQTGGPPVPQFVTKENTRAGSIPALLEIDYQLLPETAAEILWDIDSDGQVSAGANWTGGLAPIKVGDSAAFCNAITANRTVQVDVPLSLAQLRFDSGNSYTLAGPQSITLARSGDDDATLLVEDTDGNALHTISTATIVGDELAIIQHSQQPLVLSGPLDNPGGHAITKRGAGSLVISGPQVHGAAALMVIDAGEVCMNTDAGSADARNLRVNSNATVTFGATQHLAGLSIGAHASARLTPGNTKTLVTSALSIAAGTAPTGVFDLTDNALVLDYPTGGPTPAIWVREQILAGRGGSGFGATWTGKGITSSAVAETVAVEAESVSLAYAVNGDLPLGPYATFRGETVDESSLLVRYTRTGDANLDGLVDDNDVTIVGASYAPGVPQPHWAVGDFDYNGFVDDNDITLLGAFYDPTATPLVEAPPAHVATVPEPGGFCLMAVAISFWAAWRRQTARAGKAMCSGDY